jgi:hypothetical protein
MPPSIHIEINDDIYICIFIISIIQFVQVLVLSATLNNISAISWLLVLLVEKTGVPGEKGRSILCTSLLFIVEE